MGLMDRVYRRREPSPNVPSAPPADLSPGVARGWQHHLWGAIGLIALAGASTYLTSEIRADSAPAEGALIVNVNTATQQELETIPGVGAVLAKRIVGKRPYKRIEDLLRVNGIDHETLNNIRPYVKVEGETEER